MGVTIKPLQISDVLLIEPQKFSDNRGYFSEVWNARALSEAGLDASFVQDNHSFSAEKNTLRGLHFQTPPEAQDKIIRCARGAILDIAVDIRAGSPSFGKWVAAELSDKNWAQLFVPKGFAHGFITLTDTCDVLYKTSAHYAPAHERTIIWNDPSLKIDWGLGATLPKLSEKDKAAPKLAEIDTGFTFSRISNDPTG